MKFILFVEGHTEQKSLSSFIKRWLDPRLTVPAGITVIRFQGCSDYLIDIKERTHMFLSGKNSHEIIAAIGLLDLYGLEFPPKLKTVSQKYNRTKEDIERKVDHPKFKQFFSVHELESLLFSDISIFPGEISKKMIKKSLKPETINFNNPPAKVIKKLYKKQLNKIYTKTATGKALFQKLNPEVAYRKCPYFKFMLDEMLKLAREVNL